MNNNQSKNLAEKNFWNSWGTLTANVNKHAGKNHERQDIVESTRRSDKQYAATVAQQLAEERRKENLKLIAMVVVGILATGLIVYLLGLVDIKKETSTAAAGGSSPHSAKPSKEDIAEMEASIEEEMVKGGFTSKEAYFSSELTKQATDVSKELKEFSKKIKAVSPKFNVTVPVYLR